MVMAQFWDRSQAMSRQQHPTGTRSGRCTKCLMLCHGTQPSSQLARTGGNKSELCV